MALRDEHAEVETGEQTLNVAPAFFWVADAEGRVTAASPEWYAYTGYPTDEPVGTNWSCGFHPDDLPAVQASWEEATRFNRSYFVVHRLMRAADRAYRWHLSTGSRVLGPRNELTGWAGCSVDLQHGAILRPDVATHALDLVPTYVAVLDHDGRVLFVNAAARKGGAVESNDIVGRYFPDTVWWRHSEIERQRVIDSIAEAQAGHSVHVTVTHLVEGQLHPFAFCLRPLYEAPNLPFMMIAIATDASHERELENRRQEAEDRFDLVLQGSPITTFMQDLSLRYTWVHNVPIPVADIIGRTDAELFGDPDEVSVLTSLKRRVISAGIGERTILSLTTSGRSRFYDLAVEPDLREGKLIGIRGTATDVTQRVELERERAALEKELQEREMLSALGRMAGSIAHEFGNLLMGILPFTEIIRRSTSDPKVLGAIDRISLSVQKGRRVTEEILRASRVSNVRSTKFAVVPFLEDVVQEFSTSLPNGVDFSSEISPALADASMVGDDALLGQVLRNLLLNASDATSAGGHIILRARASEPTSVGSRVVFEVSDTGCGIPTENLSRVWEPLFSTKRKGTGLGLPFVREVVTRHGGDAVMESELGRGTTVRLSLPAVVEPLLTLPEATRILIVDDDEAVIRGIQNLLGAEGVETETLLDGLEVGKVVERFAPDAVVLDVALPSIDGREVYAAIRSRWPRLPVVFSTAHVNESVLRESSGNDPLVAVLNKPYRLSDLTRTLAALIAATREVSD